MELKSLLDDPLFSMAVPFERMVYQRFDLILEEDDRGRDVFYILSGEVQVRSKIAFDGRMEASLARLKEHDFFGELAMFDGKPRSAEVIAGTCCEIIKFDGPRLLDFMDNHPDRGYFILRHMFTNMIGYMRQNNARTKTVLQLYLDESAA